MVCWDAATMLNGNFWGQESYQPITADGSDDDVNTTPPPWKFTKKFVTKQHPSIEVKEVFDEKSDHHTSVPPRNPWHILEATNGSDDDEEDLAPNGNKEDEASEESDEAKLGM